MSHLNTGPHWQLTLCFVQIGVRFRPDWCRVSSGLVLGFPGAATLGEGGSPIPPSLRPLVWPPQVCCSPLLHPHQSTLHPTRFAHPTPLPGTSSWPPPSLVISPLQERVAGAEAAKKELAELMANQHYTSLTCPPCTLFLPSSSSSPASHPFGPPPSPPLPPSSPLHPSLVISPLLERVAGAEAAKKELAELMAKAAEAAKKEEEGNKAEAAQKELMDIIAKAQEAAKKEEEEKAAEEVRSGF